MTPKIVLALLLAAIATGVGTTLRPGSPVPQVIDSSGNALSSSLSAQTSPSTSDTSAIEFPTTTTAGGSPMPSTTTTAAGVAAQGAQGGYVTNLPGNVAFPSAPNAGPYTGYFVPGFTGNPGAVPAGNPGGAVQGLKGF